MSVESATYISQLDPTKPGSTDLKSEGDDHIRGLKAVLRASFQGISGAVTVSHTDLNSVTSKANLASPAFTNPTANTPASTAVGLEIVNAEWALARIAAAAIGGVSNASPGINAMFAFSALDSADNVVVKNGATYLKSGVVAGGASYPAAERIYHQTITVPTAPPSTYAAKGAHNGAKYVVGRANSTTVDLFDGSSWTTATLAYTPTGTAGIVWDSVNSLFVAVGGIASSTAAATSPDGGTWTLRALPSSATWVASPAAGNGYVIAFVGSATTAAYSSNGGVSWTAATLPSSAGWSISAYASGIHLIIAGGTTSGARSGDGGATWSAVTLPAAFTSVFGVGNYLVGFNSTTGYYSTDGTSWTSFTLPLAPNTDGGLVYCNGVYLLTGASANTYTSTNLTTWGIARALAQTPGNCIAGTTSALATQTTGPSASLIALDSSGFVGSITNSTHTLGGTGTGSYYKKVT